ncbi:MAG: toll/interleukin-1 receptor domain-containing protein [Acidobacteriota bacterium]|nr:toll/interleukin-1 receptor domain-containing protein [Acidobacteriota bacterium]
MTADLFISYAWTSNEHREWVRLLAAHLKAIGYDVLVDADVDYGDDLNGFMRRALDSRHVLLIVDDNYVIRADTVPTSGVAIENAYIERVYDSRPVTWLSVAFKDNPYGRLPAWLGSRNPRAHDFRSDPSKPEFPGSDQVTELWRWIENLPANREHEITPAVQRQRARMLEVIEVLRDPGSWSNPALEGDVDFAYEKCPSGAYTMGLRDYRFVLMVSTAGADSVYVYCDPVHAVGINRARATTRDELASQLTPGRCVMPRVGEQVILLNKDGVLCLIDLLAVEPEVTSPSYQPASVRFHYRVITDADSPTPELSERPDSVLEG